MKVLLARTITVALTFGLAVASIAQGYSVRRGDKAFVALAYHDAITHYNEALRQGGDTGVFAARLAESCYNVRDFANAAKWYGVACARPAARATDVYNGAQSLRATGRFAEADVWMARYRAMAGADGRATEQLGAVTYAAALEAAPVPGCTVENVLANCTRADMGGAYWGDRFVFASSRKPEATTKRRHAWDGHAFLDLYVATVGTDGELTSVEPLDALNTRYHESNAAFTAKDQEVWFTRNNHSDGRTGKSNEGVVKLKLYSRILGEGKWMVERPFPYNNDEYSTGHPAFSGDGRTLFFASDMPGGHGGADIWMSRRKSESEWEKPVNLGTEVNTEGDELFPFIDATGALYFASDGHPGLGGLDIFVSRPAAGAYGRVANAGVPINSRNDDFGLVLHASGTKGYITSDRSGGMGGDDLYRFTVARPLGASIRLEGTVRERGTEQPMTGQVVVLSDVQGVPLSETTSDSTGRYRFVLEEQLNYRIATKEGTYRSGVHDVATGSLADTTIVRDIVLAKVSALHLWIVATDARTKEPLPLANVSLRELRGQGGTVQGATDAKGELIQDLPPTATGDSLVYRVQLEKAGYFPKDVVLRLRAEGQERVAVHERVDCRMEPIGVGADMGKAIDLAPIHFDLGKSDIRKDAAAELNKVVRVMLDNPNMVVELRSHTDSRGNNADNLNLSQQRALTSAAYIVGQGIARDRITGKGFGETRLMNRCANGVKCSDAEHQANRRTEFIIVKL